MKLIQKGSRGPDVKKWQEFLNSKGYDVGTADGIFGNKTRNQTQLWQADYHLVSDGIVGKLSVLKAEEQGFEKQSEYLRDVDEVIVHITASNDNATVEQIRQGHLDRGFSDIGYHWIVDRAGVVHKGRDEAIIGAHVAERNVGTIGISYIARGSDVDQKGVYAKYMTEPQRIALENKVAELLKKYKLSVNDVSGHNQYNLGKACPCFWVPKSPEFINNIQNSYDAVNDIELVKVD